MRALKCLLASSEVLDLQASKLSNEARPWDIFPRETCPRDNFGLSHFSDTFLLTGTLILSQGLFCNSPGEMCPRDMSLGHISQGHDASE